MTPVSEFEKPNYTFNQANCNSMPTEQELRERYEEQQRRLACPNCGEVPFLD